MMTGRKTGEKRLAEILPGVVRDKGWEVQMDLHSLFPRWKELFRGSDLAEQARPLKISQGVLWVEVVSSAWVQQLRYQKPLILDTLNDFLQKSQLKDIRFTLTDGTVKEKQQRTKVRFQAPSAQQIASFKEQISFLEDAQTKEALMRFWYLSAACVREEE